MLCSSIFYGPDLYPCILLPPDLCSEILLGPDLRSRILHAPDLVLLRGPDLRSGILYERRLGILYGLYGSDLRPCIFVGRPSLELTKQGFGWWLTDFGLLLIGGLEGGSSFVARGRLTCSRRQSLSAGG